MRQKTICIALSALCMLTLACNQKKQSDNIITERVEKPKPKAPIRMPDYDAQRDVQWVGNTYQVTIHRQPSDSLPMVKDEIGQKFVDNAIDITVTRADGSVFFSKTFTKKSFDACLDDDYRKTGILEGLVFDKAVGDNLEFAGSVSHPQTDEYIPVRMILSRMGNVTTQRDEELEAVAKDTDKQ